MVINGRIARYRCKRCSSLRKERPSRTIFREYGDQGEKDAVLHRFVICSVSIELLSAIVVGLAMADRGAGSGRTVVVQIEISTSSVWNLTGVESGMEPVLTTVRLPNS